MQAPGPFSYSQRVLIRAQIFKNNFIEPKQRFNLRFAGSVRG